MLKVLELFAGIGACSKALERLGIEHEIVDAVEIDKYAIKSFNAIHGTKFEVQDITKWDKDVEVDLIMHGSPCQDFSVAGKQAGGDEGSGTRSSLMYETIRIVEKLKPKYVIWENVKNVISKKHKHNFDNYVNRMSELGYNSYYQVLNAKDYGIPQNRERVFTVSIRKDVLVYDDYNSNVRKDQDTIGTLTTNCGSSANRNGWKIIETNRDFKFPEKEPLKLRLKDMLEEQVDEKYYLSDAQIERIKTTNYNVGKTRIQEKEYSDTLCARDWKDPKCVQLGNLKGGKWDKINESCRRVYSREGISPTVHTCQGGNTEPKIMDNKPKVKNPLKDKTEYGWHFEQNVYDVNGITRSIKAGSGSGNIPKAILEEKEYERTPLKFLNRNQKNIEGDYAFCVDSCNTGGVKEINGSNLRIRKLTPRECWRLMGFDDEDFRRAEKVNSNTQLYKQAREFNLCKCIRKDT